MGAKLRYTQVPLPPSPHHTSLPHRLVIRIHSHSPYTAAYSPSHILVDTPDTQASRFTAAAVDPHAAVSSTAASTSTSSSSVSASNGDEAQSSATKWRAGKEAPFVQLELERVSVVDAVGFGKYHKVHPCNLAAFDVFGGADPDPSSMMLLLRGGLKNDHIKEKFNLLTRVRSKSGEDVRIPIRYIRIVAHAAHSHNYNVSIWHVWLEGNDDAALTERIQSEYESHRHTVSSHQILAHLRRSRPSFLPVFSLLSASLPPQIRDSFECPSMVQLHQSFVVEGKFDVVEDILEDCFKKGLFEEWDRSVIVVGGKERRRKGVLRAHWELLSDGNGNGSGSGVSPSARGGHQLVRCARKLILFGGWDGETDLGDLWEWDLPRSKEEGAEEGPWRLVHGGGGDRESTTLRRPGPRSCHQLVADERSGDVYLLGGKAPVVKREGAAGSVASNGNGNGIGEVRMEVDSSDGALAPPSVTTRGSVSGTKKFSCDFWRYRTVGTAKGTWELLSTDTGAQGGPHALHDHQMVIDSDNHKLYVFGGKLEAERESEVGLESRYSGLYEYDLTLHTWRLLLGDPDPPASSSSTPRPSKQILSRIGHSMILDPSLHTLYIFSGQRGEAYLPDLWSIRLPSPTPSSVTELEVTLLSLDGTSFPPSASVSTAEEANGNSDGTATGLQGPRPGFTQRMVLDPADGEWTLLTGAGAGTGSGMGGASGGSAGHARTGMRMLEEVWRRDRDADEWERVSGRMGGMDAPVGRFASQIALDSLTKRIYLFGGNPGGLVQSSPNGRGNMRLDDFWKLNIVKPSPSEAMRRAKFNVRKQRFTEMCRTHATPLALHYLQNSLSAVVDHTDPLEASAFLSCMNSVLTAPSSKNYDVDLDGDEVMNPTSPSLSHSTGGDSSDSGSPQTASQTEEKRIVREDVYKERHAVWEKELLEFFPEEMKQPKEVLGDLVLRNWNIR